MTFRNWKLCFEIDSYLSKSITKFPSWKWCFQVNNEVSKWTITEFLGLNWGILWLTHDFDNERVSDITSRHQWIKQYHCSSINSWFCKNHSILAIFLFGFIFSQALKRGILRRWFMNHKLWNFEPFLVTVFSFLICSKTEFIKRGFNSMIFHILSNSWFNRREMLSEFTLE